MTIGEVQREIAEVLNALASESYLRGFDHVNGVDRAPYLKQLLDLNLNGLTVREILTKFSEGKWVELAEDQSLTEDLGEVLDDYDQYSLCLHRALQEKFEGFRRVRQ